MKRVLFFLPVLMLSFLVNVPAGLAQVANVVPSVLHFGEQGDSTTSEPVQVTLTNIGNADLVITSMAFTTGTNFTLSNNDCITTVSALSSCTFELAFSPVSIGSLSDILTITDNSLSGSTQTVDVDGTGVGIATATPNPTSLTFGSQVVGSPSSPQSVTITNTGTADLSVIGFVVGGENPANFTISNDSCIGSAVAPNESCQFSVVFAPLTLISSSSAYLSILSDATNDVPLIPMTGGESTPFYDGGCSLSQRATSMNFSLIFDLSILGICYFGIRKWISKFIQ